VLGDARSARAYSPRAASNSYFLACASASLLLPSAANRGKRSSPTRERVGLRVFSSGASGRRRRLLLAS
jgi:hypothetical protein